MSGFGMIVEDPFYDEDGQLVDEDADWEDLEQELGGMDLGELSPYGTINS